MTTWLLYITVCKVNEKKNQAHRNKTKEAKIHRLRQGKNHIIFKWKH